MTDRSYAHGDTVVILEGPNRGMVGTAMIQRGYETIGVVQGAVHVRVDRHMARLLTADDRIALSDDDLIEPALAERFGHGSIFIAEAR